ncbi:MAG: hypothetical protein P1U46_04675 [Patescibacteria group bacterium]|nr:hypothetical protein [Patescibacteria group bacterium]
MRNIILFMIFLIISFFVNVLFYYVSEDYRFFLKNIKTDEKIVTNSDYEITDDLENIEENNFNQNDNIISLENEKNIKVTEIKL